jgi:hypothetical protein
MARELSVETERAEERIAGRTPEAATADEGDYGFGRSRPLTPEEQRRLAREQGGAIASGRARGAHIVLNTPRRRAIFIGGLLGLVVLGLALAILG